MESIRDVTPKPDRRWLPGFLFAATFLTTTIAGAVQQGVDLFKEPLGLLTGLPFSLVLMTILIAHEMSHYLASRTHNVPSTLPFFIPAPSIIGTFGAVIRMKGAIWDRRALLDIGASGPIGGFLLALPALAFGLGMSEIVSTSDGAWEGIVLGDSLLMLVLEKIIMGELPAGSDIILHPVAFAGWLGMFVTSLNLLPVGQLDGGHITKALYPDHFDIIARITHFCLIAMGLFFWEGWLIWALLLMFLGVGHPPVLLPHISLDDRRRKVGYVALAIFVMTFVPAPFAIL